MITRRRFLRACGAGSGLGLGVGFYTWRIEPHWLEIVERPLPISDLPQNLIGTRLAQFSDLHIGPRVDDHYLKRSFARIRELSPEFVVYTGDFTSYEPNVFKHAGSMFPHLPLGRLETFGILGNHDYGPGWSHPEVAEELAAIANGVGVRVLRNQVAEAHGLYVAGIDDVWAGRIDIDRALKGLPVGAAALVLSHNPDTADIPEWNGYTGWILAGHTHGGQCKPPFLAPPLLPVINRRYTAGEFLLSGQRRLYISRGLGHLIRVRFNVRPEVTVFQLELA